MFFGTGSVITVPEQFNASPLVSRESVKIMSEDFALLPRELKRTFSKLVT